MSKHIGDHKDHVSKEINKMPLPPDEKLMLQAVENMQETVLGETLEAIKKLKQDLAGSHDKGFSSLKVYLDDHSRSVHGKMDGHAKKYETLANQLDHLPDHAAVMKGVDDLLVSHLGDHNGKMMRAIDKLPLPPDEKVLLNGIENSLKTTETTTLEAIKKMKSDLGGNHDAIKTWLADHSQGLHGKLDGHAKKYDNLARQIDRMPDHDAVMKGVDGLLVSHIGDHNSRMMRAIDKLPLPPDEKVLLNAIENSLEASVTAMLDGLRKLKADFLGHTDSLHIKFDDHGKHFENLAKLMGGMPEHDSLMKGVHGLLSEHLADHGGKITSAIKKLPLPPDEKVMLQAIENMQESVLGTTLEAINDLKKGHTKTLLDVCNKLEVHGARFDDLRDLLPNHEHLMTGVHRLLADHMLDHGSRITSAIDSLRLSTDEKVLLQAIENMEETVLNTLLDAINNIHMTVNLTSAGQVSNSVNQTGASTPADSRKSYTPTQQTRSTGETRVSSRSATNPMMKLDLARVTAALDS
jgi:hypothetical protein